MTHRMLWLLASFLALASAAHADTPVAPNGNQPPLTPGPSVVINELLAANTSGLRDEDGDSSDWIEIANTGSEPVNLDGWFLTDDPGMLTKWRFPAVSLPAGGYQVVFASGKERVNPAGPLHTNFRLDRDGEYLGLVNAQTNVVSEFAPKFPAQQPDVSYGRDSIYPFTARFYSTPTPGAANTPGATDVAPAVEFSVNSRTFVQPFVLTLSTPTAGAEIRYEVIESAATVSNVPSPSSPLYSGPIAITNSVQVRARAFGPGSLPGPLHSESYVRLDPNVLGFSSDLPVVVIHTFGTRPYPFGYSTSNHTPAFMAVYEPRGGRTTLTNPPATTTRIGLNVHGGSTAAYQKSSFNLETWDEFNQDKDVALLGMPAESDWLFHAPNNFELSLMNHSLINELSRQAGQYAPRTRLVEVFVSTNTPNGMSGVISSNQYNGIYAVMEKIKRNPSRVAIDRLDAADTNAPAVTGGYLLKMERTEPHEVTLIVPPVGPVPGNTLIHQDPEGYRLQRPERSSQKQYISNYFAAAASSLASVSFTNPTTGYAQFIDSTSWVDMHILNVLAFNVDAFRLGGFIYKPRDVVNERGETIQRGRLSAGPLYDFDRSLGSTDGRDFNPRVWRSTAGDLGTDFFHYWWYDRLFRDPDFWQKWIDRWQELRLTSLSHGNITTIINSLREELREAQPRELRRWGTIQQPRAGVMSSGGFSYNFGTNGYEGEVGFLKYWLSNRIDFIDTNFVALPKLSVTGDVLSGFTIHLTPPASASAVIYYTLNGTDPRLPGGSLAPGASVYSGPINVATNARLYARVRDLNHRNLTDGFNPPLSSSWSGPVTQTLVTTAPPLRITELMYHPTGDPLRPLQFEYIELRNIGPSINLRGFRLRGSVNFTFPDRMLEAGQYVLVVGDLAGFSNRYGPSPLIAGQYNAPLGDESSHVVLEGPLGEIIHDFTYSNEWFPVTAGLGFSLVIQSEYLPLREWEEGEYVDNWSQRHNWRQSTSVGGSPGTGDPLPPIIAPVLINEVLARPSAGQNTFIELYNLHGPNVDLGGWFLSDDFHTPKKFRIPNGTLLPVGTYAIFNESQFNAAPGTSNSFALRPSGGAIYLFSANPAGELTGYSQGFQYGPSEAGVSIGRFLTMSTGEEYVAQVSPTPGAANAGPKVGPVVISEIMYHPVDYGTYVRSDNTDDEYIEVKNITAADVALFDPVSAGTWRISGGVQFAFPSSITLPPQGYALIVRFDPIREPSRLADFRNKFIVPENVPIFGPFAGTLDNAGATVELQKPELYAFSATRYEREFARVDHVNYSAEEPWPGAANGVGPSLNRMTESAYGNDAFNWAASSPTPGSSFVSGELPVITQQPQSQVGIAYQTVTFTVVATASTPLTYQWRYNGSPIYGATAPTLVLPVPAPSQAGIYDVVVLNSSGAVSSMPASLVLRIPLQFTLQPQSLSKRPGETAAFSVAVESAEPPVHYQWLLNGAAIAGATAPTYPIASVSPSHAGKYLCAVTDGVSTSNSAPADLTVLVNPVIVQQPLSQTAVSGATVVFSVQVSNTVTLPIGYRWRRNGTTVSFQELNSLTSYLVVPNVPPISFFGYTVVVTNAADNRGILSSNAVLTILADTDTDGLPDEFEAAHGLDQNNPADARVDSDGDTQTNLDEYTAGTDPEDANKYLRVDQISISGGNGVRLEFIAVSNRTYTVQSTAALGSGSWSTVANVVARPTTQPVAITNSLSDVRRFYRLLTPAQP